MMKPDGIPIWIRLLFASKVIGKGREGAPPLPNRRGGQDGAQGSGFGGQDG